MTGKNKKELPQSISIEDRYNKLPPHPQIIVKKKVYIQLDQVKRSLHHSGFGDTIEHLIESNSNKELLLLNKFLELQGLVYSLNPDKPEMAHMINLFQSCFQRSTKSSKNQEELSKLLIDFASGRNNNGGSD